jgi:hypothetical protein
MWHLALALCALSAVACSRTRDVPIAELPRVVSDTRVGRAVEVASVHGERVRIESFSRIEVWREGPCWESGCQVTLMLKLDQPLEARLLPNGVELSGHDDRRRESVVQLVPRDRPKTWARLSERSASRGFIVGGVALASALATGIGIAAIVGSKSDSTDDLRGLRQVLAGTAAGGAVGSLTLFITVPLTKDLGTEL